MALGAAMLPEFDQEMATTRRVLTSLPPDRLSWRPHPKSWTMAELANHIATMPSWASVTIEEDSFDMSPSGAAPPRATEAKSVGEILQRFDQHVTTAREAIGGASDATLMAPWTLLNGGQPVFSMPRAAVLRSFVMNHLIHHRAQLSLYFRMADLPVPSIYGPSADG